MPQSLPYPMRAGLEERHQAEIPYQVLVCSGGGGGGGGSLIALCSKHSIKSTIY